MHFNIALKLLLVFFFLVTTLDAKTSKSLAYLNTLRAKSGLVPFKNNNALSRAATSHARYLIRQQTNGHYEKKGYKGFTGLTPTDRTLKAGYRSKMVMENLSVNAKSSLDAIDNLMSAIYHRFVFLNTDKDEIGEGISIQRSKPQIKTAFVYDIGSSELRKLCKKSFELEYSKRYVNNICKETSKIIPERVYEEKIKTIRRKNAKIIAYPYEGQKDVQTAFFIEHPHPIPGSKVSGYPISIQFNEAYFKKVRLKHFRLFDIQGNEIKKRKILTHLSDVNHKVSKFQFAFMPYKRLEFGMKYSVEFEATADGEKLQKRWHFTTFKPAGKIYKITKKRSTIRVKNNKKIILYFEPKTRKDILSGIRYTGKIKVNYIDANTLEVRLPNRKSPRGYTISAGGRKVTLK